MAAKGTIIPKVIALLSADNDVVNLLGAGKDSIKMSFGYPIGNEDKGPFIAVSETVDTQEPQVPATNGTIVLDVYVDRNVKQSINKLYAIRNAIANCLPGQRTGNTADVSDTINADDTDSTKLRVVDFKRISATPGFDPDLQYYFMNIVYEYTRSEDESYRSTTAGNKAWS